MIAEGNVDRIVLDRISIVADLKRRDRRSPLNQGQKKGGRTEKDQLHGEVSIPLVDVMSSTTHFIGGEKDVSTQDSRCQVFFVKGASIKSAR